MFQMVCQKPKPIIEIINNTDTIYNDSIIRDTFYKFIYETEFVPVPADVDTQSILRDYFALHHYDDTLKNDTSAFIQIKETISENKLQQRELIFINKRPTIINQTTANSPQSLKRNFSAGIYMNSVNRQLDAGGLLEFQNKNVSYEFGYSPFSKAVLFGVKYEFINYN